jgi:GAF domain-containing protein
MQTGQPYLNTRAATDPFILYPDLVKEYSSLAATPLITSGFTFGAVVIGAKHAFSENDLRLLRAIGDLTASALIERLCLKRHGHRQLN